MCHWCHGIMGKGWYETRICIHDYHQNKSLIVSKLTHKWNKSMILWQVFINTLLVTLWPPKKKQNTRCALESFIYLWYYLPFWLWMVPKILCWPDKSCRFQWTFVLMVIMEANSSINTCLMIVWHQWHIIRQCWHNIKQLSKRFGQKIRLSLINNHHNLTHYSAMLTHYSAMLTLFGTFQRDLDP